MSKRSRADRGKKAELVQSWPKHGGGPMVCEPALGGNWKKHPDPVGKESCDRQAEAKSQPGQRGCGNPGLWDQAPKPSRSLLFLVTQGLFSSHGHGQEEGWEEEPEETILSHHFCQWGEMAWAGGAGGQEYPPGQGVLEPPKKKSSGSWLRSWPKYQYSMVRWAYLSGQVNQEAARGLRFTSASSCWLLLRAPSPSSAVPPTLFPPSTSLSTSTKWS